MSVNVTTSQGNTVDVSVSGGNTVSFTQTSTSVSVSSPSVSSIVVTEKGPKGDTGATGATGPQGPTGATGAAGTTFTAGDGLDLTTGTLSTDLKSNGGVVIESNKLAVDLGASSITGTLSVSDGGTGATSLTDASVLIGNGTNAIEAANLLTFTSTASLLQITGFVGGNESPTLTLNSIDANSGGGTVKFGNPSDGESGDALGQLEWTGDDASGNSNQDYAKIIGYISEATDGQEGGKLEIKVASHNGTLTNGLVVQDGDASGEVDATIAAGTSSLTTVAGNLKVTTAESVNGNYSSLVVDSSNSVVKSDERVKTLKVTGARMKTMGSSPLTVFAAPGANTAIQMIEATMFVDYSGTDASFPSSIVSGSEQNRLQFICTPDDGVSNSTVVPLGTFTRGQVNNALSKDTLVVRDIPQVQARLGINKPIQLKFRNVSTGNGVDSVATPGSDFFFKIKYRVVDTTSDFVVSATDTALTP